MRRGLPVRQRAVPRAFGAGPTALSRDKLQAFLWPESDTPNARHVLSQLLYAQRRQVGDEALFLGRKTLRLNPAVISSDVDGFERALDAHDLESAAGFYRGPFLDAFFLKDAAALRSGLRRSSRHRLGRPQAWGDYWTITQPYILLSTKCGAEVQMTR